MNLAHRMIYYEINHSIVEVVDKKNTQKQVHLDLAYKQDDLTLTESEWEKYQTKVQKIIEENDTIFKVIDIPVHWSTSGLELRLAAAVLAKEW